MLDVDLADPGEADILQLSVLKLPVLLWISFAVESGLEVDLLEVVQLDSLEVLAVGEHVVAKVNLSAARQVEALGLLGQGLVG
jgi:hypothetical protein